MKFLNWASDNPHLVVLALMFAAIILVNIIQIVTPPHDQQQFMQECMAVLNTTAEKCQLLWRWRK